MFFHWLRNLLKYEDYIAESFVNELNEYATSIKTGKPNTLFWDYNLNTNFLLIHTFSGVVLKVELVNVLLNFNFESYVFNNAFKYISLRKMEVFRILYFYIFKTLSERKKRIQYFLENIKNLNNTMAVD